MEFTIAVDLATNVILLMSLSVIYSLFSNDQKHSYLNSKMLMGISVSIAGLIIMTNSVELEPGVYMDGRVILMMITSMYFGLIPTVIGGICLILYRIYLGGGGVYAGIMWIIIPSVIGLIWRKQRLKANSKIKVMILEQYLLLFSAMVLAVAVLFLFPNRISSETVQNTSLTLVGLYPLAGLLVSMFVLRQRQNYLNANMIKQREREYSDLFNKSSYSSFLIEEHTGLIKNVNQVAVKTYGYTYEEFINMTIYDLSLYSEEETKHFQQQSIKDKLKFSRAKHILKNKEIIDVEIQSSFVSINDIAYIYTNVTDITNRLADEKRYRNVNVQLEATLHSVTEGIISTNEYGEIEIINDIAKEYLKENDSIVGKKIVDIVTLYSYETKENFKSIYQHIMKTNKPYVSETPFTLVNSADEKSLYVDFSLSPITYDDTVVKGSILVFRDVTRDFEKTNKIEYVSQHDFLTGLYNRYFLEVEMKRLDTKRQLPISIIHGDINGLKLTNDAFGHIEGDNLVKEIANILKKATRSEDIIARWGGDEFIILLPQTSYKNALKVVERITDLRLKSRYPIMTPSISLGIATKDSTEQELSKVLIEAEMEMYSNKQNDGKRMRNEFLDRTEVKFTDIHPELGKHAKNVGKLAKEFGLYLNLPSKDLNHLVQACTYHDIGWIGVPDELLIKTQNLTQKEMETIRSHPDIGFRIMKSIPELSHLADYIIAHHEKWDGSGYPRGLKKEEIPYISRIITIIDSYDMMINNSVYTPIKSKTEAFAELKIYAGKQFDPELVLQFIEMNNKR